MQVVAFKIRLHAFHSDVFLFVSFRFLSSFFLFLRIERLFVVYFRTFTKLEGKRIYGIRMSIPHSKIVHTKVRSNWIERRVFLSLDVMLLKILCAKNVYINGMLDVVH